MNKESYQRYLKTPHWRSMRKRQLKQQRVCSLCGIKTSLIVHHMQYTNIGREPDADLIVICNKCHKKLHFGSYSKRLTLQAKCFLYAQMKNSPYKTTTKRSKKPKLKLAFNDRYPSSAYCQEMDKRFRDVLA